MSGASHVESRDSGLPSSRLQPLDVHGLRARGQGETPGDRRGRPRDHLCFAYVVGDRAIGSELLREPRQTVQAVPVRVRGDEGADAAPPDDEVLVAQQVQSLPDDVARGAERPAQHVFVGESAVLELTGDDALPQRVGGPPRLCCPARGRGHGRLPHLFRGADRTRPRVSPVLRHPL